MLSPLTPNLARGEVRVARESASVRGVWLAGTHDRKPVGASAVGPGHRGDHRPGLGPVGKPPRLSGSAWWAAALALQLAIALLLLKFPPARAVLLGLNEVVDALSQATTAGAGFVFGYVGGGVDAFCRHQSRAPSPASLSACCRW